jgi:hypothetical protein
MKASFLNNYEKAIKGQNLEMLDNPKGELKAEIEQM